MGITSMRVRRATLKIPNWNSREKRQANTLLGSILDTYTLHHDEVQCGTYACEFVCIHGSSMLLCV